MTTKQHYFVAIPIDSSVKKLIAKWRSDHDLPFKRFVHQEDYHITLAFLGAINKEVLMKLQNSLQEICEEHSPFALTVDRVGTFGQVDSPRVLWFGINEEVKLYQLQKDVYESCIRLGFELDQRAYSPHITIARQYIGEARYSQIEFTNEMKNVSWNVSSIVIYQTHMNKTPKYEVIASFKL